MKRLLSLLLALAMVFALCACSAEKEGNDEEKDTTTDVNGDNADSEGEKEFVASGETVKIAGLINTDGLGLWYAEKMGYFDEVGVDVELLFFANGVLENEALAAGEASIGFNGFAGVYSLATGDYSLIGDCDDGGGMGLFVTPDCPIATVQGEFSKDFPEVYGNAETAKGLKWAAPLGTIQQIQVDTYNLNLGLSPSDYEIVGMDFASSFNAMQAGEVDGAALSMNYCAAAEEAGFIRVGWFEETTLGIGTGSNVIVPNEYLESNYDDVVLVLRAYYKALDELQNDEQLEFDEGMAYFKEMGQEYSEEEMLYEIEVRDLYNYEFLENELKLGMHTVYAAMNLVDLGLLVSGDPATVAESVRADVLEDALGFPITVEFPEGYEDY
jgi:ABC-type nitrate/sulfonate/bicarbonate transport system substrate-binding protein